VLGNWCHAGYVASPDAPCEHGERPPQETVMKSLHTSLGWLTLSAVLSCAGLALGQTGGIERIDADTLQPTQGSQPQGTQQDATETPPASKGQGTRADTGDAAQHQYRHRWQKRSGTAGSSQTVASRRSGTGAAQRAPRGSKSTAQPSALRDMVRRRDRIHATSGASQRDQARATDRSRARQERCSEAGEHRQQRRGAGGGNAAAGSGTGSSGAGSARGGRP
jgi:hypothetical protein